MFEITLGNWPPIARILQAELLLPRQRHSAVWGLVWHALQSFCLELHLVELCYSASICCMKSMLMLLYAHVHACACVSRPHGVGVFLPIYPVDLQKQVGRVISLLSYPRFPQHMIN